MMLCRSPSGNGAPAAAVTRAGYCPITSTVRWRSLDSEFATRQVDLGLFEQFLRPFDVGPRVHVKLRVRVESREAHLAVHAIQRPARACLQAHPGVFGRAGDGAEAEHEAVRDGGRQQLLGRPLIARTVEFLGGRGFDHPDAFRRQRHVAVGTHRGVH